MIVLTDKALIFELREVDFEGGCFESLKLLGEVIGGAKAGPELFVDLLDDALFFLDYFLRDLLDSVKTRIGKQGRNLRMAHISVYYNRVSENRCIHYHRVSNFSIAAIWKFISSRLSEQTSFF